MSVMSRESWWPARYPKTWIRSIFEDLTAKTRVKLHVTTEFWMAGILRRLLGSKKSKILPVAPKCSQLSTFKRCVSQPAAVVECRAFALLQRIRYSALIHSPEILWGNLPFQMAGIAESSHCMWPLEGDLALYSLIEQLSDAVTFVGLIIWTESHNKAFTSTSKRYFPA